MATDAKNSQHWFDFASGDLMFEPVASVLATEHISDLYPGFDDAPPLPGELRTFIAETTKLFESLTGRKYTGPPLHTGPPLPV